MDRFSLETRKKISETLKRKGIIPPSRKGAKMSKGAKKRIGDFFRGKRLSKEHIEKIKKAKIYCFGRKKTEEEKKKISDTHKRLGMKPPRPDNRGSKHPNWKGGISPERKRIYFSEQYKKWRKAVFERDSYTCLGCGQVGGILNADHIKPYALFHTLRFIVRNGRTLCVPCHRKIGWKGSHLKKI